MLRSQEVSATSALVDVLSISVPSAVVGSQPLVTALSVIDARRGVPREVQFRFKRGDIKDVRLPNADGSLRFEGYLPEEVARVAFLRLLYTYQAMWTSVKSAKSGLLSVCAVVLRKKSLSDCVVWCSEPAVHAADDKKDSKSATPLIPNPVAAQPALSAAASAAAPASSAAAFGASAPQPAPSPTSKQAESVPVISSAGSGAATPAPAPASVPAQTALAPVFARMSETHKEWAIMMEHRLTVLSSTASFWRCLDLTSLTQFLQAFLPGMYVCLSVCMYLYTQHTYILTYKGSVHALVIVHRPLFSLLLCR